MKIVKKIAGLLFPVVLIISCNQPQPTPLELVENFQKVTSNHHSINYHIDYRIKYFDYDDTIQRKANVVLIREFTDTLFGGTIWIDHDSIERYYDLEFIYSINHKKHEITRYKAHEGQDWAMSGNTLGAVIRTYFLNPEKLIDDIKDSTNTIVFSDTLIDRDKMLELNIKYVDEPPFINIYRRFFFNKQNNLLQRITKNVEFQNQFQYNKWSLSDIEFDKTNTNTLKAKLDKFMVKYAVIDYKPPDKEDLKLFENGIEAPEFKGVYFKDENPVQLSDFEGKVVLLDFWYMSCYPCIMAIPHLSDLYTKTNRKDLIILGLNPMDNSERQRKKLPDFIEINKMNYPVVFIEREEANSYKVFAYPTFYIIDKTGKIAFSQTGYGDGTPAVIDSVLATLIN